jgi:hypothetical protein
MTPAGLLVGFGLALGLLAREVLHTAPPSWRPASAVARGALWVLAVEFSALVAVRLVDYLG